MKLGLYSITYLGMWYRGKELTLEETIARAKEYGYDGVEIDGKRPHGNPLDWSKARCQDLRSLADDEGIEIYAVAANNDFSDPVPEVREAPHVRLAMNGASLQILGSVDDEPTLLDVLGSRGIRGSHSHPNEGCCASPVRHATRVSAAPKPRAFVRRPEG